MCGVYGGTANKLEMNNKNNLDILTTATLLNWWLGVGDINNKAGCFFQSRKQQQFRRQVTVW